MNIDMGELEAHLIVEVAEEVSVPLASGSTMGRLLS